MIKIRRALAAVTAGVLLIGCNDLTDLDVENPNNPDADRALASPADVEALIGSAFYNWYEAVQQDCYPSWALSVASGENSSSWGNCGMQDWGTIPRMSFQNNSAYGYRWVSQNPWYRLYGVVSQVNDGLVAIDGGMQFGENGEDTPRARAFAKFNQGLAFGYLALLFDRSFVIDETADLASIQFELTDYQPVMDQAIAFLDEAAQVASTNTFDIPDPWMQGAPLTSQQLARLAKSYSARLLAANARTPEERAAVNWADVSARIDAGITEDFTLNLDGDKWWEYTKQRAQNQTWQRASYYTIGETDESGAFQAWLDTPAAQRQPFDLVTADRRITGPDGPKTDGTDFRYIAAQAFREDRGTYFYSRYYHKRYAYMLTTYAGASTLMSLAEMDLLKAEALLRLNQKEAAVALINKTRVGRGQLPPALATESVDDLMKKMQYEKRIELFAMVSGNHYFDARGWGRLITGTPLHIPVPARELETLGMALYTFGGPAGGGAP